MNARDTSREQGEGELDPGVDALLRLAGVDDEALELAEQRLAAGLTHVGQLGVTIGDLGVVGQAYTRGVGPIAQAEAEIIGAMSKSPGGPSRNFATEIETGARDASTCLIGASCMTMFDGVGTSIPNVKKCCTLAFSALVKASCMSLSAKGDRPSCVPGSFTSPQSISFPCRSKKRRSFRFR